MEPIRTTLHFRLFSLFPTEPSEHSASKLAVSPAFCPPKRTSCGVAPFLGRRLAPCTARATRLGGSRYNHERKVCGVSWLFPCILAGPPEDSRSHLAHAVGANGNWYDLRVKATASPDYVRHFGGRMETGGVATSDPAMGAQRATSGNAEVKHAHRQGSSMRRLSLVNRNLQVRLRFSSGSVELDFHSHSQWPFGLAGCRLRFVS